MYAADVIVNLSEGDRSKTSTRRNHGILKTRGGTNRINSRSGGFESRENSATDVVKKASEFLVYSNKQQFKKSIPSISSNLQHINRIETAKSDIKMDLDSMKYFSSDKFYSSVTRNDFQLSNAKSRKSKIGNLENASNVYQSSPFARNSNNRRQRNKSRVTNQDLINMTHRVLSAINSENTIKIVDEESIDCYTSKKIKNNCSSLITTSTIKNANDSLSDLKRLKVEQMLLRSKLKEVNEMLNTYISQPTSHKLLLDFIPIEQK